MGSLYGQCNAAVNAPQPRISSERDRGSDGLIKELPLDGAVITGDAIFCQREICRHSRDANGHYLFVKDNQPELKASIAESFGDLSPLRSRPLRSRRGGARGQVGRAT